MRSGWRAAATGSLVGVNNGCAAPMRCIVVRLHHNTMTASRRHHVVTRDHEHGPRRACASSAVSRVDAEKEPCVNSFLQTIETQRWDDHRYYHQSRINQALHLVSAISFLVAYVFLFVDPAIAGLLGWGV